MRALFAAVCVGVDVPPTGVRVTVGVSVGVPVSVGIDVGTAFCGRNAAGRFSVNYRNQWASITPNPYKTMNVWGDVQLFNNRFDNGWVGLGGSLLRDQAGSGGLTSTKGFASIAYHQLLGQNSLLSGGFNVGFIYYISKLKL